jgi:3-isopropylmalate/(R)-2-methylmalate dehydratase small subunit
MEPFTRLTAVAAPLDLPNVDTDRIIPARFLRKPRSRGYGPYCFHDLRLRPDGTEDPGFVLNHPAYREAQILVAAENFGCGSSREGAVWALAGRGIRAVVAPSFGDIFHENCLRNGLLPVRLPAAAVAGLREALHAAPGATLTIDLSAQTVAGPDGAAHRFEIDAFRKQAFLEGLDDIGLTLRHDAEIGAFEAGWAAEWPWAAAPARLEPDPGREVAEGPPAAAGRHRPGRWQAVESEWPFRSGFLSIRRDRCRLPDGRVSPDMYFMELRDFAMTVAVTPDGEVLLSREYKHGAGDVAYTLPAGFVEPGETPAAAARRELREETGHDGEAFEPLGAYLVFPSLSGARGHFFLARGARRVTAPAPDEFEEIEVASVPLDELRSDLGVPTPRYVTDISTALALVLALPRLGVRLPREGWGLTPEGKR